MKKISLLRAIDQAFFPAKEIEIPELFSGRKDEIIQGLHALRSDGASLCIYGDRGVGKTSVAKQLRLVAAGYPNITDIIGKPELFDSEKFNLPTVYFCCDDTIKNPHDLFRKLLSDRDSIDGICRYNDGVILEKVKIKTTSSAELTFKILSSSKAEEREIEHIFSELDPVSAFKSVTSEIVDSAGTNSLVVVIDEFERIENKKGIASIIRTCPAVKFILVGICKDINVLIEDHESIRRQLAEGTIKINPMKERMLTEILKRAEAMLEEIRFDEKVIASIVTSSAGYPHWVHLIGKWSCIDAVEKGSEIVQMENFDNALNIIMKNEPVYEEMYKKVSSISRENEAILKILSFDKNEEQNLSDLYKKIKRIDVDRKKWENTIKFLFFENILEFVKPNFTVFKDIKFKIYSKIRSPLFKDNIRIESWEETKSLHDYYDKLVEWPIETIDLSFKDIINSWVKASDYVPVEVQWLSQKPIVYDSKGKPFKRKKH